MKHRQNSKDSRPWPEPSPPRVFSERRARFLALHSAPALIAAGFSRARNFPDNEYPFRAESHFAYLVGRPLEGAALLCRDGAATLFVAPPDADAVVWSGPEPSLSELETELGLPVRPINEIVVGAEFAALPPQDGDTAEWLSELLSRDIVSGSGDQLEGADANLAEVMIELRLRHDEAAVEQMRQAAFVTELAHRAGMAATRAGVREAVIRAAMEREIIAAGMTCSYSSIVTTHGEVLHNHRYDGVLEPTDLVLADVGAETPEGWAADVTRTWPVSGRFSAAQRELYELVLEVQRAAIAAVAPGVRYRDVHHVAGRTLVDGLVDLGIVRGAAADVHERGLAALFFPHGVGHLLGLDVHDMEDLGDRAGYGPNRERGTSATDRYLRLDRDLEPGMVVTIEPGFYQIPAILNDSQRLAPFADCLVLERLQKYSDVRGIRIEDDVLVTADGSEVLTRSIPKHPGDVEEAMRETADR